MQKDKIKPISFNAIKKNTKLASFLSCTEEIDDKPIPFV